VLFRSRVVLAEEAEEEVALMEMLI
jgi:hypothetical protein